MTIEELALRAQGVKSASKTDLYVRAWMLLLVDAAARNGITPLSKLRIHRLIYLTNCLSPLYRLRPNDDRIVKYKRGPFYPALQWHLDRLVGQGLLAVQNINHFSDSDGAWMNADYRLNQRAVEVIGKLSPLHEIAALSRYILEVVNAYASLGDEVLDGIILGDLTYSDDRKAMGAIIDFSLDADNLSTQAAMSFSRLVTNPFLLSAGDELHLYVEYLDQARRLSVAG